MEVVLLVLVIVGVCHSAPGVTQPLGIGTQPIGIGTQPIGIGTQPVGIGTQPIGGSTQSIGISTQTIGEGTTVGVVTTPSPDAEGEIIPDVPSNMTQQVS